jgi:hypothetical protein
VRPFVPLLEKLRAGAVARPQKHPDDRASGSIPHPADSSRARAVSTRKPPLPASSSRGSCAWPSGYRLPFIKAATRPQASSKLALSALLVTVLTERPDCQYTVWALDCRHGSGGGCFL